MPNLAFLWLGFSWRRASRETQPLALSTGSPGLKCSPENIHGKTSGEMTKLKLKEPEWPRKVVLMIFLISLMPHATSQPAAGLHPLLAGVLRFFEGAGRCYCHCSIACCNSRRVKIYKVFSACSYECSGAFPQYFLTFALDMRARTRAG